jgi:sugar O-acyltransferase (sialic acid O-acetyltransferase NeuD family)
MINVIILGSGAVAAEVCSYIRDINKTAIEKINVKGFIDDNPENFKINAVKYKFDQPYLGTSDSYEFKNEDKCIFGFANIKSRLSFLNKEISRKMSFITIIHPTALIADTAIIGNGNLIYPNCVIGPNATIGNNNIFTSYSFISHDCHVGNNNFFSTSGLSGNVTVRDNNFFGIRVTVIPEVTIGSNNLIQAGMTIDKNVSDDETVFYRYKEKISIINKNNL